MTNPSKRKGDAGELEAARIVAVKLEAARVVADLERWKREASIVIARYDAIFELVETVRPARPGDFKSDHVAAFVRDAIDQGLT